MPYRPKDIYRGRRKFRVPLTIISCILAFLIILTIVLFYVLQQFLVYDQSGVTLQLPFMQEDTAKQEDTEGLTQASELEPITVQVIYDETDFSQVDLGGWEDLSTEQVRCVSYEDCSDIVTLTAAISNAIDSNYTGVVLVLKDASGQLVWDSAVETAIAYGTSGTLDLSDTIASLHEQGLTVAAQISCCADALMATRNWSVALQTIDGATYQDEDGTYWLDPYNRTVRSYLSDLMLELADMGFDEIILADLYHPVTDTELQYTTSLQMEASPVTAVCQMGRTLVEALEDRETAVSVLIDQDSLRYDESTASGQDIEIFWRLFARIYCPTSLDEVGSDYALTIASMQEGDADIRFVPVCASVPEGFASYCIQ